MLREERATYLSDVFAGVDVVINRCLRRLIQRIHFPPGCDLGQVIEGDLTLLEDVDKFSCFNRIIPKLLR